MMPQMRRPMKETCEFCRIEEKEILRFISYEWIHPVDIENQFFDEEDIARISLVQELEDKLGVNEEGVDIILHLLDQLNRLHIEIKKIGEDIPPPS